MCHLALARVEVDHRPGHYELAALDPGVAQQFEEHRLVGKDVCGIAIDIVQRDEIVVEEGRRPGAGEHVRGIDPLDVPTGACHLVDALLAGESGLQIGREVVRDRIPDRARELDDLRVERTELAQEVGVARAGVVLVEHAGTSVVDHDERVTERSVGRRGEGEDRHREPVEVDRLRVTRTNELFEADCAQLALQEWRVERGQQHPRALVDMASEPFRIEMIAM